MGVALMLHRLLYGHWPRWEACDYDGIGWRHRCRDCGRKTAP